MKKLKLIKRIEVLEKLTERVELLEAMQKNDRTNIEKIKSDIYRKGEGLMFDRFYCESGISTHIKIKKILEYLGIEIYEKASEIKIRSTKAKKKKSK